MTIIGNMDSYIGVLFVFCTIVVYAVVRDRAIKENSRLTEYIRNTIRLSEYGNKINILKIDRVRSKYKGPYKSGYYYEDESIPYKEKVYTLHYNIEKTGYLTKGEMDWADRMMKIDAQKYNFLLNEFKADYKEFINL